jgi:hypothetical protein
MATRLELHMVNICKQMKRSQCSLNRKKGVLFEQNLNIEVKTCLKLFANRHKVSVRLICSTEITRQHHFTCLPPSNWACEKFLWTSSIWNELSRLTIRATRPSRISPCTITWSFDPTYKRHENFLQQLWNVRNQLFFKIDFYLVQIYQLFRQEFCKLMW